MKSSERSFARRIDLTSLQLFVAVCELGSIGRAAEREFIAASAVSKRLSELESTLGTSLLYRHARGVDLTPALRFSDLAASAGGELAGAGAMLSPPLTAALVEALTGQTSTPDAVLVPRENSHRTSPPAMPSP